MQDEEKIVNFRDRANKVREIAQGVFDKAERRFILRFVADSEKLATSRGAKS